MPRKASPRRRVSRHAMQSAGLFAARRPRTFEWLEDRRLLSANDLLVTDLDNAAVLRMNENSGAPAYGGVPADVDNPLVQYSGVAVAQNGSFYVASLGTGEIFHYSNSGSLIDSIADPTEAPGTLTFGPNGNLYVGDLAGAVYQIDPNTDTIIDADTISIEGSVGGLAFLANGDLLVGNLSDGSVSIYSGTTFQNYLVDPGTVVDSNAANPSMGEANDSGSASGFMEPGAMVVESNGDVLIADFNWDFSNAHNQIVLATPSTPGSPYNTSSFINFGIVPGSGGFYDQPESMLVDADGNLLVGLSPDHADHGSVEEYNINTGAYISTVASGIGTPTGLAYVPSVDSDLLISDLDNADVSRSNYPGDAQVPGGVPTDVDNPLVEYSGVAVAPNGSYYVSSLGTGSIFHYSSNGTYLDTITDPTEAPGTLVFGPNGNLYVGDLDGAVYQIGPDTDAIIDADTLSIEGSVGGLAFLPNGNLLVGNLSDGSVSIFSGTTFQSYLVAPGTVVDSNAANPSMGEANDSGSASGFMEPGAMLVEQNGDVLIADFNWDFSNAHNQIVLATPSTPGNPYSTSSFISFGVVPGSGGLYNQPESMLIDQSGQLLVGLSPDHAEHGSVQAYNLTTGAYISTVASGIGTPTGLAMIQTAPVVTTSPGATNYTAGGTVTDVDSGLTLSDTNQLPSLSATVAISSGLQSGDSLSFTNQNGITGSFNAGTGTLTLTGSATAAQYQTALASVSFSSSSTSTVTRTISFSATDSGAPSVADTKNIDVSAPVTITAAYVSGSAWTSTFLSYLGTHTNSVTSAPYGNSSYGYALQTGSSSAQLQTLPWFNIDTITVTFSGSVQDIGAGSLDLVGGSGGTAPAVTGFSSLGGNTYQWTLASPLTNNRYVFAIATTGSSFGSAGSTQVVDSNGAGISGTFTTGHSLPSGNGLAATAADPSTFDFFFNVLPGDVNRDGQDNGTDVSLMRPLSSNTRDTSTAYSPYDDVNGDGQINTTDLSLIRPDSGRLATGSPTAPADTQVGGLSLDTSTALGVIETSTAPASSTTAVANVIPVSSASSSASGGSSSGSASGDASSSTSTLTASNQATDEAVSDFDLTDLLV